MSFVTIGDILAVTVDSMAIADGVVTLMVSDRDGVEYTMRIGHAARPPASRPQPAPEAPEASQPALGQGSPQPAGPGPGQGPSQPDPGAKDQPDPGQPAARPTEFEHPDIIALWLAEHPEDLRGFSARLSLTKRRIIGGLISDLLGTSGANSEAMEKFTAVDPPPDFSDSGTMWGYEGSPIADSLHEGQIRKNLEREATSHARVDSRFENQSVRSAKGGELSASDAASQFKDWSDAAMGR